MIALVIIGSSCGKPTEAKAKKPLSEVTVYLCDTTFIAYVNNRSIPATFYTVEGNEIGNMPSQALVIFSEKSKR